MVASLPGPSTAFTRLATQRPIAWIGERSYGIYLWHWPVIVLLAALLPATAPGSDPSLVAVVLSLGVTFALAAASYRWIEMPVRRHGFRASWTALRAHSVALGTTVAVVGLAVLALAVAPEKTDAQLAVERGERAIEEQNRAAEAARPRPPPPRWGRPGRPSWPVPPGDLMIGFGDSVLSGAAPAIYERFPGIVLDVVPIRQWKDAPAVVQAADRCGNDPSGGRAQLRDERGPGVRKDRSKGSGRSSTSWAPPVGSCW